MKARPIKQKLFENEEFVIAKTHLGTVNLWKNKGNQEKEKEKEGRKGSDIEMILRDKEGRGLYFGGTHLVPFDVVKVIFSKVMYKDHLQLQLVCLTLLRYYRHYCDVTPQTGYDIRRLHPDATDGEYTLYMGPERTIPANTYIKDIQTNPKEYLTLHHIGGSFNNCFFPKIKGSDVMTHFYKIRINPKTLFVKTDDFTYALSSGFNVQIYWNGNAKYECSEIPYGTARACGSVLGTANIDLRGTPFKVISQFIPMGCNPKGEVIYSEDDQVLNIKGGGGAGRMSPVLDITRSDRAQYPDYDNEGSNGGWVLQLAPLKFSN
eukprot:TRINITY_DN14261_c0_g1_i1.p1 TRINITY_DN14261_c0_g1~~TRINITY_DN14261_c0_g1_i1.p1  ORF type:complete len:320 (+),score=61.25 TRINITY_DN14261_c0_g1_i1:1-960(+)